MVTPPHLAHTVSSLEEIMKLKRKIMGKKTPLIAALCHRCQNPHQAENHEAQAVGVAEYSVPDTIAAIHP